MLVRSFSTIKANRLLEAIDGILMEMSLQQASQSLVSKTDGFPAHAQ